MGRCFSQFNSGAYISSRTPLSLPAFHTSCCSKSELSWVLQVYPGAWTAVLVSLDNVGVWNIRAQNLDTWYLGQEVYMRIINPEPNNRTELPMPDNVLYCGVLKDFVKYVIPKVE